MTDPEVHNHPDGGETRHGDEVPPGTTVVVGDEIELNDHLPDAALTDGWLYEGVTSYRCATDPLTVDAVHAIQKKEVSGGGDFLHRRVMLTEENRVGPAEGGSPDHRELETDRMFDAVGVVTSYHDGPLTETAGVVMAEVGFQVSEPKWYWTPIENEAVSSQPEPEETDPIEADCTCGPDEACDVCGGQS